MKALEVKKRVFALIESKIGKYRQGNVPAIWIGNPPFGQIADGLEVNISSYPEFVITRNQLVSERWTLRLIQYPTDEAEQIYEAIHTLKNGLNPHPAVTFIDRPGLQNIDVQDLPFLPTATLRWELQEIWDD